MIENNSVFFIIMAVVIIAALAFYAGKLLLQLRKQTQIQQQTIKETQQAHNQHDKKILDSVVIIVRAMKEEQCDFSEGCWRLSVLLDSLKTIDNLEQQFPAIFELYHEIKHMPIMKERSQLAKQERMKLDLERAKVEAKLTPTIVQELSSLHQYALDKIFIISK